MKTYIVYCPELGEDCTNGRRIHSINHCTAAEIYAHGMDKFSESILIFVLDVSSEIEKKIRVNGYVDINYCAYEQVGHHS